MGRPDRPVGRAGLPREVVGVGEEAARPDGRIWESPGLQVGRVELLSPGQASHQQTMGRCGWRRGRGWGSGSGSIKGVNELTRAHEEGCPLPGWTPA